MLFINKDVVGGNSLFFYNLYVIGFVYVKDVDFLFLIRVDVVNIKLNWFYNNKLVKFLNLW